MTAATYSVFGRAALGRSAQTWAANSLPRWAYNVALTDPLAAKGKTIFEAQSCNACHGDSGVGTAAAPALVGIAAKSPPAQLAELLKHPTAKMNAGGMPAVDLPPDDLKALIAYVESFKYPKYLMSQAAVTFWIHAFYSRDPRRRRYSERTVYPWVLGPRSCAAGPVHPIMAGKNHRNTALQIGLRRS